jgi:hypothetical protein
MVSPGADCTAEARGRQPGSLLDSAGELSARLDVTSLAATFFVDEAGIIRSRVRRALSLEEMQAGVRVLQRDAD